jgi:tetratricopeptide (TPR) repeat protein
MAGLGSSPEDVWKAGNHFFRSGRYPEALAAYTAAADALPESHAVFHNRALARAALADSDGALEDVWRALEIRPESSRTRALAASLHAARGSESRALRLSEAGAPRSLLDRPSVAEAESAGDASETPPSRVGGPTSGTDQFLVGAVPEPTGLIRLLIDDPEE